MAKESILKVTSVSLTDAVEALARPEWVAEDKWSAAIGHVKNALGLLDIDFALDAGVRSTSVGISVCKPINEMVLNEGRIDKALLDDPTIKMIVDYTGFKLRFILLALKQDKWEQFLASIRDNGGMVNLSAAEREGGFAHLIKRLYPLLAGFGSELQKRMYGYQMMWDFIAAQIYEKFGVRVKVVPHEGFSLRKGGFDAVRGQADKKKGGGKVAVKGGDMEVVRDGQNGVWKIVEQLRVSVAACLEDLTGRRKGAVISLKETAGRLKEIERELSAVRRDKAVVAWELERSGLDDKLRTAKEALAGLAGKSVEEFELSPQYSRTYVEALRKLEKKMPKSLKGAIALEEEKAGLDGRKVELEQQLAGLEEELAGINVLSERVEALPGSAEEVANGVKGAVSVAVRVTRGSRVRAARAEGGGVVIETLDDLKANLSAKVEVTVTEKSLIYFEKNNDDDLPLPEVGNVLGMKVAREDGDRFFSLSGGGWTIVVSRKHVLDGLKPKLADGKPVIGKSPAGKPDVSGFVRETASAAADFNVVITDMKELRFLEGMEAQVTVTDRNIALLRRGSLAAGNIHVGRVLSMTFKLVELGGRAMRLVGDGCKVDLVSDGILAMLQPRIRKQLKPSAPASGPVGAAVVGGGVQKPGSDLTMLSRALAGTKKRLAPVDSGNGVPRRGELKSLVDSRGLGFFRNERDLFYVAACLAEDYDGNGVGMPSQEIAGALQMDATEVKAAVKPLRECFAGLGLDVKVKSQKDGDILMEFAPKGNE